MFKSFSFSTSDNLATKDSKELSLLVCESKFWKSLNSSKKYLTGTFKKLANCSNLLELTPLVPFSYFLFFLNVTFIALAILVCVRPKAALLERSCFPKCLFNSKDIDPFI